MTQITLIDDKTVSFFMPMALHKRGGHKMIIVPEGGPDDAVGCTAEVNANLLNALVRAALWDRQLKTGKYAAMKELCEAEKITRKYVQLILRLNLLAPDIKEAILEGKQPRDVKLIDMRGKIPLLWEEQRQLFRFEG